MVGVSCVSKSEHRISYYYTMFTCHSLAHDMNILLGIVNTDLCRASARRSVRFMTSHRFSVERFWDHVVVVDDVVQCNASYDPT